MSRISTESIYDEVCLIKDAMQSGFKSVDKRLGILEKDQFVDVSNGSKRIVKVRDLTVEQHADIKVMNNNVDTIKTAVQPILDFNQVHITFKKYKIYWLLSILIPGSWLFALFGSFLK